MTASNRNQALLDRRIQKVLNRDACSGCGACTALDVGLKMKETAEGYLRPVRVSDGGTSGSASRIFDLCCPGVKVSASAARDTTPHATMGAYVSVSVAWATNEEIRRRGSSGGALTALTEWLLESGKAARVIGAASAKDSRRSVPITIISRSDALSAAGSRYSPVAILSEPASLLPGSAVVGKPCEVSAKAAIERGNPDAAVSPLLISFFCAGTPSALATERLLAELQVSRSENVEELWYRGRGWPGRFTAILKDRTVSADYEESWGRTLGPTTQWRCKICPDGVGESADIVAADYWTADARGFPSFVEGNGVSALIARTRRGHDTILEAVEAGVIHIEDATMDSLAAVQPLQRERRTFLAARLAGAALAGRFGPRYRRFGLLRLTVRHPRKALTVIRGAYRRVRRSRTADR